MMDTTPTLEMLMNPLSPDNRKAINKQLKIIDTVLQCTRGVVLGGCPRDHFAGVAAADIDIYVPTVQDIDTLVELLGVQDLSVVFDSALPPPTEPSAQASHYRNNTYLRVIYEGTAVVRGDRTKLNIMLVNDLWANTTLRSSMMLGILPLFEHSASHFAYCKIGGVTKLIEFQAATSNVLVSSNPEYNEKVLRKLLLRNDKLGTRLLAGSRGMIRTPYNMYTGMSFDLNPSGMIHYTRTRSLKKNRTLGSRVTVEYLYDYNFHQTPVSVFSDYEEGVIDRDECIARTRQYHLDQASKQQVKEGTGSLAERTARTLQTLWGSGVQRTRSAGSLPSHWVSSGGSSSTVQSSGREDAELVRSVRYNTNPFFSGVSDTAVEVRINEPIPAPTPRPSFF